MQTTSGGSTSRDKYRDLVAGVPLAFTTTTTSPTLSAANYSRPAKPRLDPLGSPGPVTPLALEDDEGDGYLGAHRPSDGAGGGSGGGGSAAKAGNDGTADLVEHLIQRENERLASQGRVRKENKGR